MTKQINYIGENLFPGNLGYFFVVLSFGAAILSLIAYLFYAQNENKTSWRNLGRIAFGIHGAGVIGIFVTLFYLIYTHQFQYNYVWEHSSKDLAPQYMIACFWEGQEGSFLLWTFWNFIIGIVLIITAKKWEGPVFVVLTFAQVMLASMLLGINDISIFGHLTHLPIKLGSNPFILLRQAFPDLPMFGKADYMSAISTIDGRGLNVLLQNYWMVIHPPILFLGFATTIVPFAFAMAGIWKREFGAWVKAAMPWSLFNGMVLGTGILMGGAWAYEALSFGGFWAWDPVENASLVPWMIMIAGLHCMLIYQSKKSALGAAYILVTLGFLLILYSTFLTRSGILGDSSVHSFTDLGLSGQLLIFMLAFVFLAAFALIMRWKSIPKSPQEDEIYSREFWMFIGALVLSLAALHIIVLTSIPVLNKLDQFINYVFHSKLPVNLSKPADPIATYHLLQIPFAIIIALLTGFAQFLKFRNTHANVFWKKIFIASVISIPLGVLFDVLLGFKDYRLAILLIASTFTIIGNGDILISFLRKRRVPAAGAAIAHIGIGFILLGALIANGKKETISVNTEHMSALDNMNAKEQMENKVLYKNFPVQMQDYTVEYLGDSSDKGHVYYKVHYKKIDPKSKTVTEEFDLHPYLVFDKARQQMSSTSPSTRHYLTKDIFTHITAAANPNDRSYKVIYDTFSVKKLAKGQSIVMDSMRITLENIVLKNDSSTQGRNRVMAKIKVVDDINTYYAEPAFDFVGNTFEPVNTAEIHELGLAFIYRGIDPATKESEFIIEKGNRPEPIFIAMKATIFPYINLLWIGAIIMIIGFATSIFYRIRGKATL